MRMDRIHNLPFVRQNEFAIHLPADEPGAGKGRTDEHRVRFARRVAFHLCDGNSHEPIQQIMATLRLVNQRHQRLIVGK